MNSPDQKKLLFSNRGINLAAFLGGPLAGGILVYRNLKLIGKNDLAHWVLLIFILVHVLLIYLLLEFSSEQKGVLITLSVFVLDVILFTFLSERLFGKELTLYEEMGFPFRSNWLAAFVGLQITGLLFGIFVSYALIFNVFPQNAALEKFHSQFSQNEERALVFYEHFSNSTDEVVGQFIIETYIPAWLENIGLIQQLREQEVLDTQVLRSLEILEIYCEKRIELGQVFLKGYPSGEDWYFADMDFIESEIDSLFNELGN